MRFFIRRIFIWISIFGLCMAGFLSPAIAVESRDAKARALAHYTMGLIHDWNGSVDEAIEEYQKSIRIEQDNYATHLKLGSNYGRVGDFEKAVKELEIASDLNPKDIQAHYLLALIYSSQSKEVQATNEYEIILTRIAEENPESPEAIAFLGQLYYSEGKTKKAIEQFEKIILIEPNNAEILSILGSLYLEVQQRKKAIDFFKRAIAIDPIHDGSLNSLGYLYAEDGINIDEAIDLIQRALTVDPENGAYLDSLGWAYYKKGDYEKALLFLERAAKFIEDPVIYDHIGDVYLKMNKPKSAVRFWQKSVDMLPDQKEVLKKIQKIQSH
ncbi:MAG: tetratricopeptide repeat protein [Candidatus Omnitrophica bacterium]|nr:tetratricopeptide repeat protein [Candidatus Omnitrophota bacterium]